MRRPSYLNKDIPHPNETDAENPMLVTVRWVETTERDALRDWITARRVATGVAHPTTGNPIRDEIADLETGEMRTGDAQLIYRLKEDDAREAQLRGLALFIVGWKNHFDESGQEIPFTRENLPSLGQQYLDVTTDEEFITPASGTEPEKREMRKVTRRFTTYLALKAADPKTFDADPTVNGSAKP